MSRREGATFHRTHQHGPSPSLLATSTSNVSDPHHKRGEIWGRYNLMWVSTDVKVSLIGQIRESSRLGFELSIAGSSTCRSVSMDLENTPIHTDVVSVDITAVTERATLLQHIVCSHLWDAPSNEVDYVPRQASIVCSSTAKLRTYNNIARAKSAKADF